MIFIVLIISTYTLRFYRTMYFFIALLLFTVYFFRVPRFDVPVKADNLVYSPAFGKVIHVEDTLINGVKYKHVAIFISITDPHIQYSPIRGFLSNMRYVKGKFNPAMFLYKSNDNERLNYHVNNKYGEIIFTQIAGMIARTIVPFVKPNRFLDQGEEIGLIKFGSRCDIFIPDVANLILTVNKGDKVKGGQTVLGMYT